MESVKFRSLLYADIFDYPLTEDELEKWKIADKVSGIKYRVLSIGKTDGFYHLGGRARLAALRKERQKISALKHKIAIQAVNLLKIVPTIRMIAVTGALSMYNAKKPDDIDLLIVAKRGTLWLTRALSTILLDIKSMRRRPGDRKVSNKICLNMFLEEANMTLPKNERDLYGAHEVYQAKPLFARDNTYERFLKANNWARKFLPNGIMNQESGIRGKKQSLSIIHNSFSSIERKLRLFIILEWFAKYLQLLYMRGKRTNEVITSHMLRFHPNDYRENILREYQKRLKRYGKEI